jgi:type VI secretion system protein ImpD
VMDCRWPELVRDLERAPEFDQSAMFDWIYNQEFGMPGGVPFSLLIGLYELQHKPSRGRASDDVNALRALSRVCAAAFTPMITGVAPAMFGVDRFGELDLRQSLAATLSDIEHRRLMSFAQSSDARFIALVAPRILLRTAYVGREAGDCGFRYEEHVRDGGSDELWGNGALAVGHICLRAFNENRWLAAIRGTTPNQIAGGVVANLPVPAFATDAPYTALKFPLEINVSAAIERDMAEAGIICLKRCKETAYLVFYNLPTLHRPKLNYSSEIARVNAQLGAMLNYILCVSRFAHYLKVIGREWIGSMKTAEDCQLKLQTWLHGFCSAGDPLQDGRIQVREAPGKAGAYECTVHLKPHFQLDQAVSEFQLTTTLQGVEHAL